MVTPPLQPEEVIRVLDGMSYFQKRALKKAGFKWDGLHRLAANGYGAGLVEAVLACHTELLGRPPRAGEPDKAQAAHRHPGVGVLKATGYPHLDVSASGRGRLEGVDPELIALADAAKRERKQAKKAQRGRRGERWLP